jgi:hypothetical protein
MNGGRITLTTSEQRRLIVLNQLEAGVLVNAEAAALSQPYRGRQPHNAVDDELSLRVVELATTKYAGFNQQHLTEKLGEEEASISRDQRCTGF